MTADSPVFFPAPGVCKCRSNAAIPWACQLSCFISSLLQGHILPLHVPCVHLRASSQHSDAVTLPSKCRALKATASSSCVAWIQLHGQQPHNFAHRTDVNNHWRNGQGTFGWVHRDPLAYLSWPRDLWQQLLLLSHLLPLQLSHMHHYCISIVWSGLDAVGTASISSLYWLQHCCSTCATLCWLGLHT